jgi:hypothetical protein
MNTADASHLQFPDSFSPSKFHTCCTLTCKLIFPFPSVQYDDADYWSESHTLNFFAPLRGVADSYRLLVRSSTATASSSPCWSSAGGSCFPQLLFRCPSAFHSESWWFCRSTALSFCRNATLAYLPLPHELASANLRLDNNIVSFAILVAPISWFYFCWTALLPLSTALILVEYVPPAPFSFSWTFRWIMQLSSCWLTPVRISWRCTRQDYGTILFSRVNSE